MRISDLERFLAVFRLKSQLRAFTVYGLRTLSCASYCRPSSLFKRLPMSSARIANVLFSIIVMAAIAQCVSEFPLLPDRMASHFGPSGMPNGWMTKSQFFAIYALALLPALAVEFWVARRIARSPGARFNLPNKEFWLAPERREETFAYFKSFFAWYGCALLLLLVYIMGLAVRANLDPAPRLPTGPTVTAIAAFLAFNIVALIAMFRRFSVAR